MSVCYCSDKDICVALIIITFSVQIPKEGFDSDRNSLKVPEMFSFSLTRFVPRHKTPEDKDL